MDYRFTEEQEAFRQELRDFLSDNLGEDWRGIDPDAYFHDENWFPIRELTAKMAERGWLTLAWPKEYGGQGRPHIEQMIYNEETAYFRAPTRDVSIGTHMVGPTLMLYGTEEQKSHYLPEIASGEAVYCQGFSEPESGSDLASLQLRAIEDGDDYVLSGSKIWTSGAHRSTHCYLLTRTDPDAPKHRGISVFIVDMNTPGIEVRPIINMFGIHYFNQVFFDNVRVPKRAMIGEKNRGWYIAATTLDFERSGVASFASNRRSIEELVELARETGTNGKPLSDDPIVRQRLAELWTAQRGGQDDSLQRGLDAEPGARAQPRGVDFQDDGQRDCPADSRAGRPNTRHVRHTGQRIEVGLPGRKARLAVDGLHLADHPRRHFRDTAQHHRGQGPGPAPRLTRRDLARQVAPDCRFRTGPRNRRVDRKRLMEWLFVALGGSLGALSRFAVDRAVTAALGPGVLPTFLVNVAGSFALGVFVAVEMDRASLPQAARPFVAAGFLASFTTFSTLTVASIQLIGDGHVARASVNLFGSIAVGLVAAFAGIVAGRELWAQGG